MSDPNPIKTLKKGKKNFARTYTSVSRHTKKQRKNGKASIIVTGYTDNTTGRKLNRQTQKRLETYYVPPAYNNDDILVAKSVNNRVQVICEDTAGRKQYIYHPKYLAGKERRKYNKLTALAKYAHQIECDTHSLINRLANVKATTSKPFDKETLVQLVIYMLITYHFRIGCREYEKEYGSTGISTLRPQHFQFTNADTVVKMRFKGKKGVYNHCEETWGPAVKVVRKLCSQHLPAVKKDIQGEPGIESEPVFIFSYIYSNPISDRKGVSIVTSQDVACYLTSKYGKDAIISPKMFRTWYANYHVLDYLRSKPPSDPSIKIRKWIAETTNNKNKPNTPSSSPKGMVSEKQQMAWLKREIPVYVSSHLNNTPSVCKSDYINNRLLQDVLRRPEYYRKRALLDNTNEAKHKLVAQVLGSL